MLGFNVTSTCRICLQPLKSIGAFSVLPLGLLLSSGALSEPVKDADLLGSLSKTQEVMPLESENAPVDYVDETQEAVATSLETIMRQHPRVGQAQQDLCAATYAILEEKSAYFPQLNAILSGGNKMIDKTTRGDAFGGTNSPEYDGKGVNLTLTLNQQLYDWGQTGASIKGKELVHESSSFEGYQSLQDQLYDFLTDAILHERETRILAQYQSVFKIIQADIAAIEKRFKGGAGRIAELRAAQIIGLDLETSIKSSANRQLIALKNLKTNFEVDADFAQTVLQSFISRRENIPAIVETTETFDWRGLNANYRSAGFERMRLKASQLPKVNAVLQGQAWDIDNKQNCGGVIDKSNPDAKLSNGAYRRSQNCNTFEVTGRLELSMPLYDGGLNKAQRNRSVAFQRSIEAEMAAIDRRHRADSRRIQEQLTDALFRYNNQSQKVEEMTQQLASERVRQGQLGVDPLATVRLEFDLAQTVEKRISIELELELIRLEALYLSDKLLDVLDIRWETNGC